MLENCRRNRPSVISAWYRQQVRRSVSSYHELYVDTTGQYRPGRRSDTADRLPIFVGKPYRTTVSRTFAVRRSSPSRLPSHFSRRNAGGRTANAAVSMPLAAVNSRRSAVEILRYDGLPTPGARKLELSHRGAVVTGPKSDCSSAFMNKARRLRRAATSPAAWLSAGANGGRRRRPESAAGCSSNDPARVEVAVGSERHRVYHVQATATSSLNRSHLSCCRHIALPLRHRAIRRQFEKARRKDGGEMTAAVNVEARQYHASIVFESCSSAAADKIILDDGFAAIFATRDGPAASFFGRAGA